MARTASLFALASGRLTLLSRSALIVGLVAFLAVILLVRPVHQASSRLAIAPASVIALDRASPWVDRAALQDGGALLMSVSSDQANPLDAAQPDASPFPPFGPEYLQDPSKALALPSSATTPSAKGLDAIFPLGESSPYVTLGQKASRESVRTPRTLHLSVYSDLNENVFKRDFRSGDTLLKHLNSFSESNLTPKGFAEFRLGIDGMGLQSKPYLLSSSGDVAQDQRVGDWLKTLPWATWLKPGAYRVVVGP